MLSSDTFPTASYLVAQGYHPTDPTKTKIPLIPSSTGASHIVPLPSLQASNTIDLFCKCFHLYHASDWKSLCDLEEGRHHSGECRCHREFKQPESRSEHW